MSVLKKSRWAILSLLWGATLFLLVWRGEWPSLQASEMLAVPLRFGKVHTEQRPWKLREAAPPRPERAAFAAVYGPNYVRQNFRCPADNLSRIALWIAGPVGEAVTVMLEGSSLDVRYGTRFEVSRASGGYYNFVFSAIPNSKGRVFFLTVSAPDATFERAISLRIAPGDRLGGSAYLNAYPVAGNIDVTVYHSGLPGHWWLDVVYERIVPSAFRSRIQQYKPNWVKRGTFGLLAAIGFLLSCLVLVMGFWQRKTWRVLVPGLAALTTCLGLTLGQIPGRRGPRIEMLPEMGATASGDCCQEQGGLEGSPHATYDLLMNFHKAARSLSRERDRSYAWVDMPTRLPGSRPSLALAAGRSMAWGVQVLPGTIFRSALAPFAESAWFELWVAADGAHTRVLRQQVHAADWFSVDVDLGDYVGQSIKLELVCPQDAGYWAAPHLLTDSKWLLPYPLSLSTSVPGWVQVGSDFGDEIELLGYSLNSTPVQPGATVHIDLYWHGLQRVGVDYTAFVHLLDANGTYITGHDSWPVHGFFPTMLWEPDQVVVDSHALSIATDLASGEYDVEVGLYELTTMTRLPASAMDGSRLANDVVWIEGAVIVEPKP